MRNYWGASQAAMTPVKHDPVIYDLSLMNRSCDGIRSPGARRSAPVGAKWKIALKRISFIFLLAVSAGLVGISLVKPGVTLPAQNMAADLSAPLMAKMSGPIAQATQWRNKLLSLGEMSAENDRLKEKAQKLTHWHDRALHLEAENKKLRTLLSATSDIQNHVATTRIIADDNSPFSHSVLIRAGSDNKITKGQAVLSADGMLGRIVDVGQHSARVLLLSDRNSHIPVLLQNDQMRAVLKGASDGTTYLHYLPQGVIPHIGERVVTSGFGGMLPAGLPIGIVSAVSFNEEGQAAIEVTPFASIDRTQFVKVIELAPPVDLLVQNSHEPQPSPR